MAMSKRQLYWLRLTPTLEPDVVQSAPPQDVSGTIELASLATFTPPTLWSSCKPFSKIWWLYKSHPKLKKRLTSSLTLRHAWHDVPCFEEQFRTSRIERTTNSRWVVRKQDSKKKEEIVVLRTGRGNETDEYHQPNIQETHPRVRHLWRRHAWGVLVHQKTGIEREGKNDRKNSFQWIFDTSLRLMHSITFQSFFMIPIKIFQFGNRPRQRSQPTSR